MYYIERIFACQYFLIKKTNKYSEYMFAFLINLWYDNVSFKELYIKYNG